jgi:hypothetical protein
MVMRWWRRREPGWQTSIIFNGIGALATFLVLLVVATTKFGDGAWMVVVLLPLLIWMFRAINTHYTQAAEELAAADRFLTAARGASGARQLADGLHAEQGYERALAAALGSRLAASVVEDLAAGQALLQSAGEAGGTALVSSRTRGRLAGRSPAPGAQRLVAHVRPEPWAAKLAERLLADVRLPGPRPVALGRVSLWGRVFENTDGWRAQFAYPYELFVLGGDDGTVRALRDTYAVDVLSLS